MICKIGFWKIEISLTKARKEEVRMNLKTCFNWKLYAFNACKRCLNKFMIIECKKMLLVSKTGNHYE